MPDYNRGDDLRVRTFTRFNLPGPSRPAESVPLAAGQRGTFSHSQDLGELVQGEHFVFPGIPGEGYCPILTRTVERSEGYRNSGFSLQILPEHSHDGARYEIIRS